MLDSQLEIVQQATDFLNKISPQEYVEVLAPHLSGSAGKHMRHVLDHYQALQDGLTTGVVDYNQRHRGSDVEACPTTALQAWQSVANWLKEACNEPQHGELEVITETSVTQTEFVKVASTFARELVFVSSHAIHHFSLLAIIASLQGRDVDPGFGIAPATATFLRQQA